MQSDKKLHLVGGRAKSSHRLEAFLQLNETQSARFRHLHEHRTAAGTGRQGAPPGGPGPGGPSSSSVPRTSAGVSTAHNAVLFASVVILNDFECEDDVIIRQTTKVDGAKDANDMATEADENAL